MRCVRDGSENPLCFFFKKHKDCSEQPDPKLPGGTTKQFAGSRPKKKRTLNPLNILSQNFRKTPYC
jgi:hypothetical protein